MCLILILAQVHKIFAVRGWLISKWPEPMYEFFESIYVINRVPQIFPSISTFVKNSQKILAGFRNIEFWSEKSAWGNWLNLEVTVIFSVSDIRYITLGDNF